MTHRFSTTARLFYWIVMILVFAGLSYPVRADEPVPTPEPNFYSLYPDNPFTPQLDLPERVAASVAPQPSGGPDHFGYTWSVSSTLAWTDAAAAGTAVSFPTSTNSFSDPQSIGFSFKYYENAYDKVSLSSNGFLLFGEQTVSITDAPIPLNVSPNNFIAVFADGLNIEPGTVYKLTGGSAPNRYIVFQWDQVVRKGASDSLTFEVILYENGNIAMKYKELNGTLDQALIGIEDRDGLDGLTYLQNSSGLQANISLVFQRPQPSPRLKLLAQQLSDFATSGQVDFHVLIRNTGEPVNPGESAGDTFNLAAVQTEASNGLNWSIKFFNADKSKALTDSNHDGIVDTGSVAQGATAEIVVSAKAPQTYKIGDYARFDFTATSSADKNKQASLPLLGAVPADFAQASVDIRYGLDLDLVTAGSRKVVRIADWFSGTNMAIASRPNKGYIYAWEQNGQKANFLSFTDIEYALVNSFGKAERLRVKLTDHQQDQHDTWMIVDRLPALTVLPNGRVGIVWLREIVDFSNNKTNENIFLAVLDARGNILGSEANLTHNNYWGGPNDFNNPDYTRVAVAGTHDGRLVVTWVERRFSQTQQKENIFFGVYDDETAEIAAPTSLTSAAPNTTLFKDAYLTRLDQDRALVTYSGCVPDSDTIDCAVYYAVLDSSGNQVRSPSKLNNINGWRPTAVQLSAGPVVLAWTNSDSDGGNGFVIIDNSSLAVSSGPTDLVHPANRWTGFVSIARDENGHAVLTWIDEYSGYLFYALVDGSGTVLTPAMVFYPEQNAATFVTTSLYGQGNTNYVPAAVFIPLVASH